MSEGENQSFARRSDDTEHTTSASAAPHANERRALPPSEQRRLRSSFLPELFPSEDPESRFRDSFGEGENGVDYGPPSELEMEEACDREEVEHDGEGLFGAGTESGGGDNDGGEDLNIKQGRGGSGGRASDTIGEGQGIETGKDGNDGSDVSCQDSMMETLDSASHESGSKILANATKQMVDNSDTNPVLIPQTIQNAETAAMVISAPSSSRTVVTIEELEEEVGLHEATLESLNAKLSKLSAVAPAAGVLQRLRRHRSLPRA